MDLKNRIVLSPMCQYKATNKDGVPESWHFVHLVSRAIGGTGLILTEMTNVEERGRITEQCLGIYNDKQEEAFERINNEVHKYDAKIGLQIAHAGRKSTITNGDIVAPSAIPFSEGSPIPRELEKGEIEGIIERFAEGAKRAVRAGFDTIEIHGAHGYLLHQFMSKASNKRDDEYGEPTHFTSQVIRAIKAEVPSGFPLILRISAVEYNNDEGYSFVDMGNYCREFIKDGIDMFDVSTGANSPVKPTVYPGYQIKYAKQLKSLLDIPVMTVGKMENAELADYAIRENFADLVCIGRGMLKNPYWAKDAAEKLNVPLELPGVYNMGYE